MDWILIVTGSGTLLMLITQWLEYAVGRMHRGAAVPVGSPAIAVDGVRGAAPAVAEATIWYDEAA